MTFMLGLFQTNNLVILQAIKKEKKTMQFLDVKTDYAFKKVFGSVDSKDKLISFLNAIVYEDYSVNIKDLTINRPL